jgi:hypothetical protein
MNASELANALESMTTGWFDDLTLNQSAIMLRKQEKLIQILNDRIERMIEKQSHYEAMEHSAGFEAGRQLGMKQEKALWELSASTQEIENERK